MTTAEFETEAIRSVAYVARSAISDAFRAVVRWLQLVDSWRQQQWIEAQARAMSDHLLNDIGIRCADKSFIALGQARQH